MSHFKSNKPVVEGCRRQGSTGLLFPARVQVA